MPLFSPPTTAVLVGKKSELTNRDKDDVTVCSRVLFRKKLRNLMLRQNGSISIKKRIAKQVYLNKEVMKPRSKQRHGTKIRVFTCVITITKRLYQNRNNKLLPIIGTFVIMHHICKVCLNKYENNTICRITQTGKVMHEQNAA